MERQFSAAEYFFHRGTNYRAYDLMGAHLTDYGGRVFRVWAPRADAVSLVGDSCDWAVGIPMSRVTEGGIWECTVERETVRVCDKYKFKITAGERTLYKSDPYSAHAEGLPNGASVICDVNSYEWRDSGWMSYRRSKSGRMSSEPINVYCLSAVSWNSELRTYSQLATELAPYVKQMGYTHVELDGVTQRELLYAPDERMGEPVELMRFIDAMHEAGIGVIIDRWMLQSFEESYGLGCFDGQRLYERAGDEPRFELGCPEVECFLVSNAHYWFEKYHVDGLRVRGIESEPSLDTVGFFKKLNAHVKADFPDVLMICDDMGNLENVTNFQNGGLGFDLRISSDTSVSGEKYMIALPRYDGDCARDRATLGYFMTSAGKKISEAGKEIGQIGQSDGKADWTLLRFDGHARFQRYAAELGQLYLATPALWENEQDTHCASSKNKDGNIITLCRSDSSGKEIIILINFTPVTLENYRVGVPNGGIYKEIFNSDDVRFGGSGYVNACDVASEPRPHRKCENSIVTHVAPMAISIFNCVRRTSTPGKIITASRTAKTKIKNNKF